MKRLLSKKLLGLIVVFLVSISTLSAHGVQLRWNIVPSTGAIRVWIEHWHGRATNVANFPLNVSYTVGGVTTTQTYFANGYINGSSVAGLPDGGSTSDLLSSCGGYNGANTQNNWVFWDFNPPACNTPVSLTIVSGPAVETTEACGSLYPQTINSNFNDNVGPALTCNDITVPPSGANCDAVVANYNVSATDACGGGVSLSYSIAEGSAFAQGTTPVTATAVDQYGNSSTCTFNVNVRDNQAPTVITQGTTKKLVNGIATISATEIDNGSFDGNTCGGIANVSVAPTSFDCNNLGANTVVLTVTDLSGNISTGTATVTILDTVPPVITCTANMNVNADPGECTAIATFSQPTVTDNCAGSSSVAINQIAGLASGSSFPVGTTTNTFVVSDGSGINDTCSFDVTVIQSNPLAISIADTVKVCQGSSVQLNPTILNAPQTTGGSGNGNSSFCVFDAGSQSNCTFNQNLCSDGYIYNPGTKSLSNISLPGAPTSMGVRLYFTKCGSTSTNWTFKLNGQIIGSYSNSLYSCSCTPPTSQYPSSINIPTSQFISAWNNGGSNTFSIEYTGDAPYVAGYVVDMSYETEIYAWAGNAGISDATSSNPTVSPTSSGYYYVNYQATNGCTTSDSVYAEIVALPTVSLSSQGQVSLYGGIVNLSGGSPAGGTFTGTGVSNNQFDPSVAGLGIHTLTYTYTNSNGCSSSASSSIEVIPCNIQLSATSGNVSCPRGSDGSIDLNATNTNGAVTYQWTGPAGFTASTEDLTGLSAGNYTVIVTDANACTETGTYTVVDNIDNTPPTVLTQNATVYLDANGQGALSSVSTTTPIFSEDWSGVSAGFYSNTQIGGFNISGSIDVGNYVAGMPGTEIDLAGNANATMETSSSFYLQAGSYTFTLDHQTNTNPNPNNSVRVIIGSSFDQTFTSINSIKKESVDFTVAAAENATIKVIQLGPNDASGTFIGSLGLGYNNPAVIEIDGGSTDNCGILSINASQTSFTCADVGTQTVTLTVTDVNGNSANDIAMVDVQDTISPNAAAQNITVQLDASGSASITAADIDNGSNDACGIATTSIDVSNFSCANVGSANNVILTVVDNNGNSSNATAVVTVEDNVAPTAVAQSATVYLDASGSASITPADIDNGSSDACGIASTSLNLSSFSCADIAAPVSVVLTVVDNNGNSSTANASVTVIDNIDPVISGMPSSISITAQPNDCTPSVSWTAPSASDNCSVTLGSTANPGDNFSVGTTVVTYTATDAAGNSVSASFNVTVTPTPVVVSSTLSAYAGGFNISCNGFSDGGIDLTVSGGCEPYSYSWSNGATTEDNIGLSAGNYSVSVSDANGTVQNFSYTLTEPSPLSASAASSGYTNGTGLSGNTLYLGYGAQSINLSATVSGGVAPYTYSWSPAASLSGATTANPVASPMATTTYTATVTDANGCVITASTSVNVIDARCGKNLNKVLVCHKESKRKKGQVTTTYHNICVSSNAVAAHLAHGDYLGPCNNMSKDGDDIVEAFDYHLYPNPTSDVFTVEIHSEVAGDAKFILTDVQGRIIDIQNETTADGTTQYQFDLGRYAKGVYMLTITANKQSFVERIIKQ